MKFGSVCSGIEAASVAWHPFRWKAAWLSEIEPFPSAVLAHHYPDVPNLGDMTLLPDRIASGEVEAPDLFCGGTPCQAFSVAGLRKSLDDARGNLSLVFCEIANAIDSVHIARGEKPCVVFWENVPGVLSTKDNAFGCFIAGLAGEEDPVEPPRGKWSNAGVVLGPQRTVAWRILDAQYFGVAQRRRRVFVVASARDDFDPVQVLFEFDGMRRDSAPSRKAQEGVATIPSRSTAGGSLRTDFDLDGGLIQSFALQHAQIGRKDEAGPQGKGWQVDMAFTQDSRSCADAVAIFQAQPIAFQPGNLSRGAGASPSTEVFPTLKSDHGRGASDQDPHVAVATFQQSSMKGKGTIGYDHSGVAKPVKTQMDGQMIHAAMQVRRLTPVECERLQGFPDSYTQIPWRKKPASKCPDGPRYKALGNSWAVPVVRWIGARINAQISDGVAE